MNFLCQFDERSDRSIEPAWFESLIANWTRCSWSAFELGKDVLFYSDDYSTEVLCVSHPLGFTPSVA